tara:strand:+ start:401 stop:1057 length:657 start_codon:yes stop_codon:yes gene_type:complete
MKKILLSLIIIFSVNLNAQEFSWGPKLSVSSPSLKLTDVQNLGSGTETLELLEDTDPILGYQVGLFARISLMGIYIQPEVLLSNTKTEIQFSSVMDENQELFDVVGEVKLNKLDVPVLIGKRFLKIFRINAGPVFTLPLGEDVRLSELSDTFEDVETNYKSATVGAQIGAGLDLSILTVDLRYEMGLQSISDGITIGETEFAADQRLNQFLVSVGIKF